MKVSPIIVLVGIWMPTFFLIGTLITGVHTFEIFLTSILMAIYIIVAGIAVKVLYENE
jgi:hypothetical protein